MNKLSIKDLSLSGKKVLMRVDFNVPIKNGVITDDTKIKASLPSIEYVLSQNGSVILMSHLGRPKKTDPSLSLKPCAERLSELLQRDVHMAPDCKGSEVEKMVNKLQPKEILLLENLRFNPGEEDPENHPDFAHELSLLGNCYVNDAFGSAHRAHTSTAKIATFFPQESAMGFLMEKEIKNLKPLIQNPKRPFYAIIGGAKISTKLGIIKKLLPKLDAIFIGGAMSNTFFKLKNISLGNSPFEDPSIIEDIPLEKIHLPVDLNIADHFSNDANHKIISIEEGIPDRWQAMDIGPKTIATWSKLMSNGKTFFWNGPLGVYEFSNFSYGTFEIAKFLSNTHSVTIIGGGDSVAAIEKMGMTEKFTHLSTGGGASLEFLEFGHLPGIDVLTNKK